MNQKTAGGFSPVFVVVTIVAVGLAAVLVWVFYNRSASTTVNQQTGSGVTTEVIPINPLKKVDFDLDGTVNSLDDDDDNDNTLDVDDLDNDNDGVENNDDLDDDDDGVEDDEDDENEQKAEIDKMESSQDDE